MRHVRLALAVLCSGVWGCSNLDGLSGGDASTDAAHVDASTHQEASSPHAEAASHDSAAEASASSARVLLFGGETTVADAGTTQDDPELGDTWTFDGTAWTEQHTVGGPTGRSSAAIVGLGGKALLFGGFDGTSYLNETWTFADDVWTEVSDGSGPSGRCASAVAVVGTSVLLFGGTVGGPAEPTQVGDTWSWDGTAWSKQTPATSPPAREYAAMAPLGKGAVLFGGDLLSPEGDAVTDFGDTWVWDGSTWTEQHPAHSPSIRSSIVLVPASATTVLLFGGINDNSGTTYADTWSWDGTDWTELSPGTSPIGRWGASATTISTGILLFGGQNDDMEDLADVWLFAGGDWREVPASGPLQRDSAGFSSF